MIDFELKVHSPEMENETFYAYMDGEIIGEIQSWADFHRDEDGYIVSVESPLWIEGPFIREDMRRKGVGSELIRRIENAFNYVAFWHTSVWETHLDLQMLYKSCGYVCYESSKEPVDDGESVYMFSKECKYKPF